ncbi:hypothetical protein [Sphingomonas humi]|uniref:Uncharacterized protein n=1 Tax=Sphingomonas humi TaxID=335630 RepID=A0ABP7S8F0_9SPHN
MMIWTSFAFIFLAGFALGVWLGGRPERAGWKAALVMPLVLLAGSLFLILYLLWAAREGDSFAALAAASVTVVGLAAAALAFAGGLFGVRWRRAGKRLP